MTNDEIIELARNRLAALETSRRMAWSAGNEDAVRDIDLQIAATMARIAELESKP